MDLDEWYETVQRWRAPATGRRWRRLPQVAGVGVLAVGVAVGATQLSDGGTRSLPAVAASPTGLPVEEVEVATTARQPTAPTTAAPSTAAVPTPVPETALPTMAPPPPTTAPPPPTTRLSAPRPAQGAPATNAPRPAPSQAPPPPPPPPTTAPPPPTTTTTAAPAPAPGPAQPSNSGRLSARMGVHPAPAAPGQPVTFNASWSDTNGQLASMGIEFGDGGGDHRNGGPCGPGPAGSRSGSESFTHAYGAPGTYTVRLHVHSDDCTGGRQATVVTFRITVR